MRPYLREILSDMFIHANLNLCLKIAFDFMKFLPSLSLNISNFPYISTPIILHEVGFLVTFDSPV